MTVGLAGNFGNADEFEGGVREDLHSVSFETGSFEELEEQVTGWISSAPQKDVVSVSHSTGARWEKRYDKVSFGKLEPVNTYTALVLFKDTKVAA